MTRKAGSRESEVRSRVFRVVRGISHDILQERHEPGAVVDLSHWPVEVVEIWVEQGVIVPVKGRKRDSAES